MAKKRRGLGSVDLLGLNAFGLEMSSPIGGAVAGAGAAAVGAFVASKTRFADKKELIGLASGLAASAGLYASPKTRHMAIGSAIGAAIAIGVPMLFRRMSGQALGVPQMEYLSGLGVAALQPLNGALGLPGIAPLPETYGAHGVANEAPMPMAGPQLGAPGASAPVDLLGAPTPQSSQVSLLGGPAISGLSAAYGATLLGAGR